MNSPEPDTAKPTALDIGNVRRQIDAIDAQLAALIVQRCGLSASVAAAKRAVGDTAFGWRPAREIEILRTVMREQASLDPELAFCIWRGLISANLAAQGDLKVFVQTSDYGSAKAAFSIGATIVQVGDTLAVLDSVAHDDHAIGILPWPTDEDWWVTMARPEFSALYVCAASPLTGGEPDALLVSRRPPEPAGEDISLVCGPIGAMEGGVIATLKDLELVAIGEFLDVQSQLPTGCRLIGSFALA